MAVVGLVGFIGAGKGACADILVKEHGYIKESFAKSVKDATAIIFGWDRDLLEGDTQISREWREEPDPYWTVKMKRPFSPRLALQLMGTEAGRDVFHKDLWIFSLQARIDPDKNYVIADVRFPNEIRAIHDMGGKIIRLKRGEDPSWYEFVTLANKGNDSERERFIKRYPDVHYSEWAWIGSQIDATISNNGSIDDLGKAVRSFINMMNTHIEDNYVD